MIELDQSAEWYQSEFGRFKEPPTHAYLIAMRWAIPMPTMDHRDPGYEVMLRPHFEGVYVFGRLNDAGEWYQTPDDARHMPIHTNADMCQYETALEYDDNGDVRDSPERIAYKEMLERNHAIRDAILAHGESPHPENPQLRKSAPGKVANRFSTDDADIVFSHLDGRLRGKPHPKAIAVNPGLKSS